MNDLEANDSDNSSDDPPETGLDGIAIIGMALRFPDADSADQLWHNLCQGTESLTFFGDDQLDTSVSLAARQSPNYVKARGRITGADQFDASFFKMSPREAQIMDPQHRLFLELAWAALEDACYTNDFKGLIGVYGGAGFNSYYKHHVAPAPDLIEMFGDHATDLANAPDYFSTRVSYKLNLSGPSLSIFTGCSTSLVAVCQACDSLLSYGCDLALAGGSFVQCPLDTGYFYREGEIFSPDGHCRPFDENAGGTVFSDGVGLVALKRLDEALRDRDNIYAVIKGFALNNDGADKVSFTAPSVNGQASVIALAQANAGIDVESIIYHEAHGTGTRLGDPIEIEALTQAFNLKTRKRQFCAIGSLKANIGHLDAAAGVAGLIKASLVLLHKQIPPSVNFQKPNPQIDFAKSPFFVNTRLMELGSHPGPLRASVSSFGVGGTNAHIVLEEPPPREAGTGSRPWQLVPVSAKKPAVLEEGCHRLKSFLESHPDTNLADAAYSLKVGRKAFSHRRIIVCRDVPDAVQKLTVPKAPWVVTQQSDGPAPGVIFMFSGQGSQYAGMGKELYQSEPVFRAAVDACAGILEPLLPTDLRRVIYSGADEIEARRDQLNQTAWAQPALFTVEYALARLWQDWGIRPKAMVGHSIGEYVAACLAGVLSLEAALAVVAARGRLMQELLPGAMLAVAATESEALAYLSDRLALAAVNAPSMCVISGDFQAIEELEKKLEQGKIGHRRLVTSHAFHSHMMAPAVDRFAAEIARHELRPPEIPFLSNVTGTWITTAQATDHRYWSDHIRRPVRFSDCMASLKHEENPILLEVGPGNTLCSLAGQQERKPAGFPVLSSLRHPKEDKSDMAHILTSLGRLWLAGGEPDWQAFYRNEARRRISLPTYSFERNRYWIESGKRPRVESSTAAVSNQPAGKGDSYPDAGGGTVSTEETDLTGSQPQAAENRTERTLSAIWKELLNLPAIDPDDNYFELGGSSLFAVRMFEQIERKLGRRLPLATLYEAPTIRQLSKQIAEVKYSPSWSSLVEIKKGNGSKPPIFFMHSEGGNVLEYWPLSNYFEAGQGVYALQAKGLEGSTVVSQTVEEMAASFLSEMERVQKKGPFFLGGYCLGGLVAYEMARQLIEKGEKVNFLALVSARTPAYLRTGSSSASFLKQFTGLLSERVRLECDNLSQLNWSQKYNYIRGRLMRFNNIAQVKSEALLDRVVSKISPNADWHSRDYILYQSVQNQDHAFMSYDPKPCSADVVLFRVKNNPSFFVNDEFLGWSRLVQGNMRTFEVDCFHKNIMKEPNAGTVGRRLSELLLAAQSGGNG
jgi:phthiocerol/phenolphthiocerol synthesis type-I polyketide synthase E